MTREAIPRRPNLDGSTNAHTTAHPSMQTPGLPDSLKVAPIGIRRKAPAPSFIQPDIMKSNKIALMALLLTASKLTGQCQPRI